MQRVLHSNLPFESSAEFIFNETFGDFNIDEQLRANEPDHVFFSATSHLYVFTFNVFHRICEGLLKT